MLTIQEGNIELLNVIHEEDSVDQKDAEFKSVFHYAYASKKTRGSNQVLRRPYEEGSLCRFLNKNQGASDCEELQQ